MIAARKGSVEIVRALVQHGASVNHTNRVSYTSFHNVCTVSCHTNVSRDCIQYSRKRSREKTLVNW